MTLTAQESMQAGRIQDADGRSVVANALQPLSESTTPLGISATFSAPRRSALGFSKVRAFAFADQAGTLNVQQSWDGGVTWRTTDSVATVASTGKTIESLVVAPDVRVQMVNGGVAQTVLQLASCLVAI